MTDNSPGKFCALAWNHRFTNIGGEIQVCCTSEESDNTIRDNNGEKMRSDTLLDHESIMNSNFMKNLRQQMLAGEWPELCYRCRVTEESGGVSRRLVENRAADNVPSLLASTDPDGHIRSLQVRSFDMRLGNICNLACRMCNPYSSTSWHREWGQVDQNLLVRDVNVVSDSRTFDWYKDPRVMDEFRQRLPHLNRIHFAGGEPLIIPEMRKFLRAAVESGYSENIEVSYNTNLTIIPEELKTLWPRFRGIRLYVSVDAFGPLNEYIRYPSKWATIDRNLKYLDANFENLRISEVLLMCTVQVYNVLSLTPLYEYLARQFRRVNPLPNLVDLHYPFYYSTQILPDDLKRLAESRLQGLLQKCEKGQKEGLIAEHHFYLVEALRSSIGYMNMRESQEMIPEFLRAARSKDQLRGTSFESIVPELRALASEPAFDRSIDETVFVPSI